MGQLRSETLEHLGIDATDLDPTGTTNLDLLINRSWWDLIDRKGIEFKEKDKYVNFTMTIGQSSYPLTDIIGSDMYDAIQEISYTDPNSMDHHPIDPIGLTKYEAEASSDPNLYGFPEGYFHNDTSLYFNRPPNQAYVLNVWYKYILTDLGASNPAIPQSWHNSILFGAVAYGHLRARDYNSARQMQAFTETEIAKRISTQGKDDREMKTAGVQVYVNPYRVRH